MPALHCSQLVCVRHGTVCPVRVSELWFSPPGFRYGSSSTKRSSPTVFHVSWWKSGFCWCSSPCLTSTVGRPSCWCWISFQDRWRGPFLWCFLPGGGMGVWGGPPVRTVEGKALPMSTSTTKREDSQYFNCSLMMQQVVTKWGNKPYLFKTSSLSAIILIRMLLETRRTKSCQQPVYLFWVVW